MLRTIVLASALSSSSAASGTTGPPFGATNVSSWAELVKACAASGTYELAAPPAWKMGRFTTAVKFSGKKLVIVGNGAVLDAGDKGAFFSGDGSNGATSLELHNLTLTNGNAAETQTGGAIEAKNQAVLLVHGCNFTLNSALDGGGAIHASSGVKLQISSSLFMTNKAETSYGTGGAIYASSATVRISTTNFTGNAAGNGGGAIYFEDGSMEISASTFGRNEAQFVESQGGAIFGSGALVIRDSQFSGNEATKFRGGAVFVDKSLVCLNCTFARNTALEGGAVYVYDQANATFTGGLFAGNDDTTGHNDLTRRGHH